MVIARDTKKKGTNNKEKIDLNGIRCMRIRDGETID
jgi:hypothetical protein